MFNVAVIGAGITGLSVAATLALRGAHVNLIEALPHVGGVARATQKYGLSYAPGPQYAWGWEPDGPAAKAIAHLGISLKMRQMPREFEQLALGRGDFALVHQNLPAQLDTLPEHDRQKALLFARALDSAGRSGATLGPQAIFRQSGVQMIKQMLGQALPVRERGWGIRLRNLSVQDFADQYHLSPLALRMLTHCQGIFAEDLSALSALLYASARHHLSDPPYFPEGGFGSLIDALEGVARQSQVQIRTSSPVVGLDLAPDGRTRLTLQSAPGQRTQDCFDHVIWAISPGALNRLLEASTVGRFQKLGSRLKGAFKPSHPVVSLNLYVELDAWQRQRLQGRNFTWFEDDQHIGFETQALEKRAPRTVNFSSPTLNDQLDGPKQVICAFSHGDCDPILFEQKLLELLGRLGVKPRVFDLEYMDSATWTNDFGAYEGSLYGRRLTTKSLRTSLCDLMPSDWSLAHSGAAIPGILGCLQLAKVTGESISIQPSSQVRSSSTDVHPPRASFPIRAGLTLWLGLTLLAWEVSQIGGYLDGRFGCLELWIRLIPAQFMLCVCIHDAVHGVITKRPRLCSAAGVLLATGVFLPFPLLRRAHLKHHSTLHHHDDPERVVYDTPARSLLFKLPVIPLSYLQNWRLLSGKDRVLTVAVISGLALIGTAIAWVFGLTALLYGWLLPSLLTVCWFGFTTVYVPHSRDSAWLMRFFTEHSGWHHDHHCSPQYPFNQYIELRNFHLSHHVFEPRGQEARVIRWLSTPLKYAPKARR